MKAAKELWKYGDGEKIWVGKYRNSQNILHWHSDCELICVERGKLEVLCDKQLYRLNGGGAMLIDGGSLHSMSALSPDTLLKVIIFDGAHICPFLNELKLSSPVLGKSYGIDEVYESLLRGLKERGKLSLYRTANELERLMLEIFSDEPTEQKKPAKLTDEKFRMLLDEIEEKYEFYSFGSAADFMNMNESYFSRFFMSMAGMPFSKYLNCVRTEKAVELLKKRSFTKTEIAAKCGFATIRNFNRIFKELTGFTPSALPHDFVFYGAYGAGGKGENPTLSGCELVEYSSRQ